MAGRSSAHSRIRQANQRGIGNRAARTSARTARLLRQKQRQNGAAHGVRQREASTVAGRLDNPSPEAGEIADVIVELQYVIAVGICQQSAEKPLSTVIDNHHIIAALKQIIGHFRVFDIAFNAAGANDHHLIMAGGAKAHKANRQRLGAGEFTLFTSAPKIQLLAGGERGELPFTG